MTWPVQIHTKFFSKPCTIKARIQNYNVTFVLDTGAAVTLLRGDTRDKLAPTNPLETWTGHNLVGVEGSQL